MYNNFSSKKTKKVISALLASALVVTSGPITADAATAKVVGVKKTITVSASATNKVTGLSKAEKKVVKVTKKGKKFTIKGLKAGKATFKIGKKSYTVKVGAVAIKKKSFATSLKVGTNKKVTVTSSYGAKDTLKWSSSKTSVVKVSKATTTASAKKVGTNTLKPVKAGTATITVKSKNTGKSLKVKVTVKAATPATATPATTPTTVPTATGSATTTPSVAPTATATATATGSATTAPSVDPSAVPTATGSATTAPTTVPTVDPSATPTTAPTQTPEVVSASVVSATAVNTQDQEVSLDAVTKNGTIKVTFSETVKESSINNTNFTVTDANGKNISIPASDVKLAIGGKTAVVNIKNLGLDKKATYTLSVKNVETAKGDKVVDYKTAFTIANVAVIQGILLDDMSVSDELDTNMKNADPKKGETIANNQHPGDKKTIFVKYDELLDASTVNAGNIELVNTTTDERVPVTFVTSTTDGKVTIKTNVELTQKNLYKITIKGVKTAVNGTAEDLTHIFTVAGVAPFDDTADYKTLDGNGVKNATDIWPKITAGNKETAVDATKYYAGLQINVTVKENLDPQSVKENVFLVEKETKEIVDATVSYNEEAKMIIITPKADLKEDTSYEIQYLGGLRTTDFVYLNANKKNEVYTQATEEFKTMDVTSPEVVSIESKNGTSSLEVTKAQEFIVTFSEGVNLDKDGAEILLTESSGDVEAATVEKVPVSVAEVAGSNGKQWTVKVSANNPLFKADKAYKLRVLGKDSKDWTTKGSIVKDTYSTPNYLKKTATYTFSTENDTNAPKLVNVYEGTDITDASKVITATKTNVEAGNKFTFVFDEKIQQDGAVKIEKLVKGAWTPVKSGEDALKLTINNGTEYKTNKDGDQVAITVTVPTEVNDDAKYRIVFEKGVIKDQANTSDKTKCNEFDLYRYEFIATDGLDGVTNVNMYTGQSANGSDAVESAVDADEKGNAAVDGRFFIVLDETDITGLTSANVTVTDADGNVVAGEVKEVTDATKFGKTSVYAFVPTANLAYDTSYTVKLSGVTDIVGNKIATKAVTFKTQKDLNKITAISIEDGAVSVNRKATITIDFNNKKATDAATVTLKEAGANTALTQGTAYTIKANDDKNKYTITFVNGQELKANTTYELAINAGNVGNTNYDKKITFTTGIDSKDVVNPSLVTNGIKVGTYTMEKDGLKVAALTDSTITLTYDEEIKKDDVSVKIVNVADSSNTPAVTAKTLSTDGKKLTLTVAGFDEKNGGTYKVDISGVKDEAGNEADAISFFVKLEDMSGGTSSGYGKLKSDAENALNDFKSDPKGTAYQTAKTAVDAFIAGGGNVADLDTAKYTDAYKKYPETSKKAANDAIAELKAEQKVTSATTVTAGSVTATANTAKSTPAKAAVADYLAITGSKLSDLTDSDIYTAVIDQISANGIANNLIVGDLTNDTSNSTVALNTSKSTASLSYTLSDDRTNTGTTKISLSNNTLTATEVDDTNDTKKKLNVTVKVGNQTVEKTFALTAASSSGYITIS